MTTENYIFGAFIICVATIILLFIIWQVSSTQRAKAKLAREDEYRGLSARAVVAQEATDRRLEEIAAQLAQTRTVLESIQRTLTVVE